MRGLLSRTSLFTALTALVLFAGCGGGPAPAPATQQTTTETAPDPAAAGAAHPTAGQAAATDPNDPKSKTKWIGDIPYDVFYDQPLVVAAEASTVAPAIATTPAPKADPAMTTPPVTDTPPATTAAADASGPDWKSLTTPEMLNEAVTKLRNALNANLNTLATYNRNIEAIANDGAALAALAAVAEVHPDAVSWQDNAKYVRDLGYDVYIKADGTGRGPYDATKEPFEQIVAILNGGPAPDIESEDKVPFADIADRTELMKRIKKSYDFLRADINTEPKFKDSTEDIVRESSVMASFGGLISTESYDSADEEKYKQFVRDFMKANVDVAQAARDGNFVTFEEARNRIQKACDACHGEYAFGSDGL